MASEEDVSPHERLHDIERWTEDPQQALFAIFALRKWLDDTEEGIRVHVDD